MEEIKIDAGATTPAVNLDPAGKMQIGGKSMMENAIDFYDDIHGWLDEYLRSGASDIAVEFDFVYFNSTSAKQILKMLMNIEESEVKCAVTWKHPKDHDILKFRGAELESMLSIPFTYESN